MKPGHRDHRAALPEIVLASTSPHRQALLERLGLPFRCRPPLCDESALADIASDPAARAARLAYAKASSVLNLEPQSVVIGCDQLVSYRGRIFGKPGTVAKAVSQLAAMAGDTHQLITAMVVLSEDDVFSVTNFARLRMRKLSRAAITRYVEADQPLDCAGSYKLESRGIALFKAIKASDHTAITGLPLVALVSILREMGYEVP